MTMNPVLAIRKAMAVVYLATQYVGRPWPVVLSRLSSKSEKRYANSSKALQIGQKSIPSDQQKRFQLI